MLKDIGVVGLGLMGSSIACCLLCAGHRVIGIEIKEENRDLAHDRIKDLLQDFALKGKLTEPLDQILERFEIVDAISRLATVALVLESVDEALEVKQKLIAELEDCVAHTTVIGSNTSAIPISAIQQHMLHPERLIGIHWGEPAHISRFMEVILGEKSEPQYAQYILSMASQWGKDPVYVKKDIEGFIANRLMYAMFREAFFLLENGYASMDDIDRACQNDMGFWMGLLGPFRYMDLTGVPAYAKVAEELFPKLNNQTILPSVLREGKALSEHHFYDYSHHQKSHWEKMFLEYSSEIMELTAKYKERTQKI